MNSYLRSWLALAFVSTVLCALVHVAVQQNYRMNLNDPQIQMAEDAATSLGSGATVKTVVPATTIDISKSLAPWIAVYDDTGKVLASSARLNGVMPAVPAGVFDSVRQNGEDRVSWESASGVRNAIVVTLFSGKASGFVVAGRNMREVESREDQLMHMVVGAWIVLLAGAAIILAIPLKK